MKIIHHDIGRDYYYNIWNASKECMVIYFYTDGGSIVFQNEIYPIKKGGLCLIRAGNQHYTLPDAPDKYDRSKIYISEQLLSNLLNLNSDDEKLRSLLSNSSAVYAVVPPEHRDDIERIYSQAQKCLMENGDETLFICCFFRLILYLRDYTVEHITAINNTLTKTIDFINRNYAACITLDDICQKMFMSKYYLCRVFKNAVGMTIMEYVLKTRIAAAKKVLQSEGASVGDIAERCGFSSASRFSQVFKKTVGVTPLQYRKNIKKNDE